MDNESPTVPVTGERTDADLLRLIARDHERLAPNAHHTAETLRRIADRIASTPASEDAGRLRILQIERDEAVRALEIVRDHTDAHNPVSYRSDDREGCLDAVYAEAQRALDYIAALPPAPEPSHE